MNRGPDRAISNYHGISDMEVSSAQTAQTSNPNVSLSTETLGSRILSDSS